LVLPTTGTGLLLSRTEPFHTFYSCSFYFLSVSIVCVLGSSVPHLEDFKMVCYGDAICWCNHRPLPRPRDAALCGSPTPGRRAPPTPHRTPTPGTGAGCAADRQPGRPGRTGSWTGRNLQTVGQCPGQQAGRRGRDCLLALYGHLPFLFFLSFILLKDKHQIA